MKFPDKLQLLMRRYGLSGRALAKALTVSNATVHGWLHGAAPHPEHGRAIAAHFELGVDALLDDKRPLPERAVTDSGSNYLSPLRVAAAAADRIEGTAEDRQLGFERYVEQIHALRKQAEKLAGGDSGNAVPIFDQLLATWMISQQSQLTSAHRKALEYNRRRRRREKPVDQSSKATQFGAGGAIGR